MNDIVDMVRRGIEDDISINSHGVKLEAKLEGWFGRRKSLIISGMVESDLEKEKIMKIAVHHAGDAFRVVDKLAVKAHGQAV